MTRLTSQNKVQLVKNGMEYINLNISLINQAKKFILLHTYIFEEDEITSKLLKSLKEASKKGVCVYFIIDAFGSSQFPSQTIQDLKDNGINFCFFKPLLRFNNIGRRLHQKVLIIDNTEAIVGGINFTKDSNSPTNQLPWLDYACHVSGEEVKEIYKKVLRIYLRSFKNKKNELISFYNYGETYSSSVLMRTVENDWGRYKQEIYKSYINAINSAQEDITILATYFIPGKKLLKALRKARKRNVSVKLVFSSLTDLPIVAMASDYFYQWYLDQGIEVFEWDQSIIHGKLAMIDKRWVSIGSYNHNYISRYGNLELNIEVLDSDFAKVIESEFDTIIKKSQKVTHSNLQITIGSQFKVYLFYLLTNLITFLSLILIFRRNHDQKRDLLD